MAAMPGRRRIKEGAPTFSDVVAANVRAERGRRDWLQADLAARLGWHHTTVSALEVGKRSVHANDLPALCKVFGIPLAELCRGADPAEIDALGL